MAKMWYVGDGGLVMTGTHRFGGYIFIKSPNESHRPDYLIDLFRRIGFDPRFDSYNSNIVFGRDDTYDLLEWMGESPDGFEYKWATENYNTYRDLKAKVNSDVRDRG